MNPVNHFEFPYHDARRICAFYQSVFGWQTEQLGAEMDDYILATTALEDVTPGTPAGAINGGFFPVKPDWPDQHPSVVIGVSDIQETMRLVKQHGGEVLGEPRLIPGYGLYVSFRDTEGNRNSIIQPQM